MTAHGRILDLEDKMADGFNPYFSEKQPSRREYEPERNSYDKAIIIDSASMEIMFDSFDSFLPIKGKTKLLTAL